ncbi:hypothetical protein BDD43_1718 [Mucilaginibacter gracilis]|uniref:Uncharacterized protein n=1 Tax=Mucilaginibacter gracilis TaxID=423350 RepID=A0A495J0E9_9SPHI|nr:hypothetical protein [Mucilaginibacter gracilis]RKR81569.1 hypothetical protein BDD43_1718 [Mucilaginibacter gracilis]
MAGEVTREDVPSRKKYYYPIADTLRDYLVKYDREIKLPVQYSDLLRFNLHTPLLNKDGTDTLWQTVYYDQSEMRELFPSLTQIYALLHTDGDIAVMEHLSVARIDYCTFGNSKPFRVRIINKLNDNYDHFYVKTADASRVYGLELEHILSPNRIIYLSNGNTLIEEHIPGLPGDVFISGRLNTTKFNQIRICKEFVKFNERCFARLLGDMRSYNFVVDITPDIEGNQYRIRAIDFDQQSYEGRRRFYLPHFFKENNVMVNLGMKYLTDTTVRQYQEEERSLISHRVRTASKRLNSLLTVMQLEDISPKEKVQSLAADLAEYHNSPVFKTCHNMGQILTEHLSLILTRTKLV